MTIVWESRYRYQKICFRKKVTVLVSEKLVSYKKSWYRYQSTFWSCYTMQIAMLLSSPLLVLLLCKPYLEFYYIYHICIFLNTRYGWWKWIDPQRQRFFMKSICFLMEGFPQGEETNHDLDPWRFSGGAGEIWKKNIQFWNCLFAYSVCANFSQNK